ncbi:polysaccharide deacetylase family protein [Natronomonas gomsonensis]|uniref:polysaccharide deacetylase family protein n=1 Tax=Natronomonas gomsonensis TaxID=1046043 RepID=UPI0015B927B8|nr:polysaccharide deacetylase family protein [Natronomonas gomsonensis]
MPEDATFHLCLTHDVDRVYKRFGAIYGTLRDRNPRHLKALLPGTEPYWRFEDVMAIEDDLGVRSAFYFLNEQRLRDRPVREWLSAQSWQLYGDRYSVSDPDIVDVIHRLDSGGWEVGLHGSYESYREPQRLRAEKGELEAILGSKVVGGRQHYLNLDVPETWEMQADVGLRYDASLGSSETYGFDHGYTPLRPFDDEFVVFPLTVMELSLPNVECRPNRAWRVCERLLEEARENGAVMTVLWHPRFFYENDFPNYGALYRRLIERALELGAWVGPPGELYEQLDHTVGMEMEPNR